MPISTIVYMQPIRRPGRAVRPDYGHFDDAHALFERGEHLAALHKTLAHLFPGVAIPDLAVAPFTFIQGSSRVTVGIEGDELAIGVPLARLPTSGRAIAALRFVLTRISTPGQLFQPRLRGDDIHLEFRDTLSRLHPTKVLEVLNHMPVNADKYDDWLIGQFGALPLDRAAIEVLDADELVRAEAEWRRHWNDIEDLVRESQRKRSELFLNAITSYALHRVLLTLPLCGFLLGRMEEAATTFSDSEPDLSRREAALARFAREMTAVSGADLGASLGHAEYAISSNADGTTRLLREMLGPVEYSETIDELRKAGKPMDAAIALVATYTYLLQAFAWPAALESALADGLIRASGMPWRQAAALLFTHGRQMVTEQTARE